MTVDRSRILLETSKRLLRRGATARLRKIVDKTHPADLAAVFPFLTPPERTAIFDLLKNLGQKAMFFSELGEQILLELIQDMPPERIAEILEQMPNDDVADLLGKLPGDRAKALLDLMTKKGSREVGELLDYDSETAGGIMLPNFIALKQEATAREAIQALQRD